MTEQYLPRNINNPAPAEVIVDAAVAPAAQDLNPFPGYVGVDLTAAGAGKTMNLPDSTENPGITITVQKVDASANIVTVALSGGDTLVGAAGALLLGIQGSTTTFTSLGDGRWAVIANIP